jgi:hypothetical protein
MHRRPATLQMLFLLIGFTLAAHTAAQERERERELVRFQRQALTDVYYSEGVSTGDIDGDGHVDVVHGPYWFAGPDFKQSREIYPAKAQPRERYADNFFSWT